MRNRNNNLSDDEQRELDHLIYLCTHQPLFTIEQSKRLRYLQAKQRGENSIDTDHTII